MKTTHSPNLYAHAFPADWNDAHEVKLHISKEKRAELDAIPRGEENIQRGIVAFDAITRKYYAVRHFPCFIDSFDCCCAAQAKELENKDEKFDWPAIEFPEEDETCPHCGN